MSNRKHFPKEIVTKATRHNRGKYDYRSIGSLLAIVWIDKRSLYMLTTVHEAITHIQATVKRKRLDGTRQDVNCPPCLPDYQLYMRGVDRGDQRIGYYNLGRRSKKWWKRVFAYVIECSILNAFVLLSFVKSGSEREMRYLNHGLFWLKV